MPLYLLLPAAAAAIYALGSIAVKRSLKEGVRMGQSFHLANLVLGALFLPLALIGWREARWDELWRPATMGTVFFVGHLLTFVAIRRGDVSLVTPLMGTKVVFVAVGTVFLAGRMPSGPLWVAACLTAVGIFTMGLGDLRGGANLAFTVLATLASALFFGLCDVIVSAWAGDFGAMPFLAVGSVTVSLWTMATWLVQGRPRFFPRGPGTRWSWAGALCIVAQAMVLGIALALFRDDATGINIVYASRGLWVLVLVAGLGGFLGNSEHRESGRAFLWRVAGTLLLTAAIVIAVLDRARA